MRLSIGGNLPGCFRGCRGFHERVLRLGILSFRTHEMNIPLPRVQVRSDFRLSLILSKLVNQPSACHDLLPLFQELGDFRIEKPDRYPGSDISFHAPVDFLLGHGHTYKAVPSLFVWLPFGIFSQVPDQCCMHSLKVVGPVLPGPGCCSVLNDFHGQVTA